MKKNLIILLFLLGATIGQAQKISEKALQVQKYMTPNTVIAHRGSIYWAPELTEAAFRWARNIGADYLEFDVHRSKDGVLIVMHDKTFNRTTDVAKKFPGRENDYINTFTLDEIMSLDAGTAFNKLNPEQARNSFSKEGVLVLEDVFRIAEGKKIKRNADGSRVYSKDVNGNFVFEYEKDETDNGNRPGVYIETKSPDRYLGIEEEIYAELARIGWNPLEGKAIDINTPLYLKGKVNIGNTRGKILLQTFSRQGMLNLQRVFKGEVLTSLLVQNSKTHNFEDPKVTDDIISFALQAGAQFIGTNIGEPNEGLTPEFSKKIHTSGLKANAYSFNTVEQMEKYFGPLKGEKATPLFDGMITNRADLVLNFYHDMAVKKNKAPKNPAKILDKMGYYK